MSIRAEKVASVIKHALAQPITDLAHEHNAGLVTITAVRLSNDLQLARVYLSIYGGKSSPGTFLSIMDEAVGMLRSIIGKSVRLRHTPQIKFFLDDTLDEINRIQALLDSVKKP
jgi:ribosome-binding factor A